MHLALKSDNLKAECRNAVNSKNQKSEVGIFLIGLVMLLAFASWCHLDMTDSFYKGPRWMGLWNNPNDYGLLMGAGLLLAIGLLARIRDYGLVDTRWKIEVGTTEKWLSSISNWKLITILFIAAGMMDVGLLFSYNRINPDCLQTACRAGAIVLAVGFWFDGGLFNLATASVFWILLELGWEDVPRTA